jgi:F-type H+-transporting ATPase subunit b
MEAFLSTFGVKWELIIAQAVNFFILAGALTWLLYKPVTKIVAERARVVAQGVEDAAEAKQKLDKADEAAKKTFVAAESEAEELIKRARAEAALEKASALKEAQDYALRLEADAKARAEEDAARLLRESESEIARLALLAAEKAIRK